MQGWGWQKVHHPEHVDRVVERIRQSFQTGTPWEDTFPLRGRDGNYRWFLSRALPIRNDAGEVIRWFGTNTDITEQIEAEKALRELNNNLEQRVQNEIRERLQIWNVSEDLLVVADMTGKYLSINPAWRATLGWSESDLLGRSSEWLLHPDDMEKTRAEIGRLAMGQKTRHWSKRLSPREREVALLVARGLTNKEVGRELHLSDGTGEQHAHNIFLKLGTRRRQMLTSVVSGSAAA
jgi:PAS domain S-box-containing protein